MMSLFKNKNDPYKLHKLALAPLISENPKQKFVTAKSNISKGEENKFLNFILQNGLGPLWHQVLKKNNASTLFTQNFVEVLKKTSTLSAARYLAQQHILRTVSYIFGNESIPYAIFKGAHIREILYSHPAIRPSADIDILVSKFNKKKAVIVLLKNGFEIHPREDTISHEVLLSKNNTTIDLHWDILRPGRTRVDLTDTILATKKQFSYYWGLSDEAILFIMLIHPVFTKYVTTPQAYLIRLVDFKLWIETQKIDWEIIQEWIKKGGMQTAAWISASWLRIMTETTLPSTFINNIRLSKTKDVYFEKWLCRDLSTRLKKYPFAIHVGFTIPAHDTLVDAIRAVKQLYYEKKSAKQNVEELISNS